MTEREDVIRRSNARHGVPALLSFFIPGLGQLIKGDILSALFIFVAAAGFGFLCFAGIGFVLLPILWIWQIYNAYTAPDGSTKRDLRSSKMRQ